MTEVPTIFVDTSALICMGEQKFSQLLASAKQDSINLCISEVVLWERSKQQQEFDKKSLMPRQDFGIPINSAYFKKLLTDHYVLIIEHSSEIIEKAEKLLSDKEHNFNLTDYNELRDAHILSASCSINQESVVILTNDKGFKSRASKYHKTVVYGDKEIKEYAAKNASKSGIEKPSVDSIAILGEQEPFSAPLLSVLEKLDPTFYKKYLEDLAKIKSSEKDKNPGRVQTKEAPENQDKLESKLANMQIADAQLRKRVLGYTHWFSPTATKADLHKLLLDKKYTPEQIECHAKRLKDENLLIETDNRWLTNIHAKESKEICEQAMAAVMPEILEIMELA